ncbi:PREDICTED: heavy metal-associated isoprenylated plant protein 32-like [Ipomoea nil]|uniref:heavy metal-associated isoprenylated plant protein 32-like n=1 Tax=Ipomoea nil TaxID=35883 RepID=UPI000900EFEA|nr:PREDICTED: heavy metal-associated isoprenylated plant protein 32-like [Ipomoea nil]
MEPYADASCILRVDINCDACKFKMIEVISSVAGVYSISIDAEENLVKICGEVDPNRLLSALAREGKHAKIVMANLKHPQLRLHPRYGYIQGHDDLGNGGGHGYHPHQAFPIRGALPHHSYYPYHYPSCYIRFGN